MLQMDMVEIFFLFHASVWQCGGVSCFKRTWQKYSSYSVCQCGGVSCFKRPWQEYSSYSVCQCGGVSCFKRTWLFTVTSNCFNETLSFSFPLFQTSSLIVLISLLLLLRSFRAYQFFDSPNIFTVTPTIFSCIFYVMHSMASFPISQAQLIFL